MVNNLYLIYDTVAKASYGNIIRVSNDEVARRSFHDALRHPESPFKNHEKDYILVRVGNIDETVGTIQPENPITIGTGADWVDANKEAK